MNSNTGRRHLARRVLPAAVAVLALTAASTAAPAAGADAPPHTGGSVQVPKDAGLPSGVEGYTVLADDDIWAVGAVDDGHANPKHTLIVHWDGTTWLTVPSPDPGSQENDLTAVSGVSSDDVWAVGYYWNGHGNDRLLTEHWDGTSWTVVANETPGGGPEHHHDFRALYDVRALAPDDAWMVGYAARSGPVAEHWDGTSWQLADLPPKTESLYALGGYEGDDLWAAGQGTTRPPAVLHYDGADWSSSSLATLPHTFTDVIDIDAAAPGDAWAVGDYQEVGSFEDRPLVEHFDGSRWRRARGLPPMRAPSYVRSVAAPGPDDVWIVAVIEDTHGYHDTWRIDHWDGAQWQVTHLPDALRAEGYDLAALGPDDIWVLTYGTNLLGHWDGSAWHVVG